MKTIHMFKLKNIFVIVLLFLSVINAVPPVAALTESGTFISSEGFQDLFYTVGTGGTANVPIYQIRFNDISYYPDSSLKTIKHFYNSTGVTFDAGRPRSAYTPFTISDGDVSASGQIGYGQIDAPIAGFMLYMYFDSWIIGDETGTQNIQISYNNTALYNPLFSQNGVKLPTDSNALGLAKNHVEDVLLGNPIQVSSTETFINEYEVTNTSTYKYSLNVTRVVDGSTYQSYWKVYTDSTVFMNESTYDGTNFSILVDEAPIYLECYDIYNNSYSATIHGIATGSLDVHGHTINAENNAIISDVLVGVNGYANLSNESGYYEVDGLFQNSIYNLTANKTDYMPYELNISTATQDLQIDIPLFKYGLNESGNYDSSVPYLAGVVKHFYNYSSIKNAVVTLRNNSTTYNAITSTTGLFSIYPDANGTYTLTVIKPGYYSHESTVNINGATSQNIALFPDIEDVEEEEEDYTPGSPIGALYDFFDDLGLSSNWVDAIVSLALIAGLGLLFSTASKDSTVPIVGMFFGFVVSIALGLLPLYFLTIVIIVVIALLLSKKFGG